VIGRYTARRIQPERACPKQSSLHREIFTDNGNVRVVGVAKKTNDTALDSFANDTVPSIQHTDNGSRDCDVCHCLEGRYRTYTVPPFPFYGLFENTRYRNADENSDFCF